MRYKLSSSSPDAHIVELLGPDVERLANLTRHRADLDFAARCLDEATRAAEHTVVREALWQGALINFFKCFYRNWKVADGGRERLVAHEVVPPDHAVRGAYDLFDTIRREHIAHDQGTYMSGQVSIALVRDPQGTSRLSLITSAGVAGTDGDQNLQLFAQLLQHVRSWVNQAWNEQHTGLLKRVAPMDHTQLRSMTQLHLE